MKIWTIEHTFNHPWETVVAAALKKYPNPLNEAVLGTDIIDRKIINGTLYTHRLVVSEFKFPRTAQAILGHVKTHYASEKSEVNPATREMVLRTRNLSFSNYIDVGETLRYIPHPQDKNKTLLKQEAIVTVQGAPLASYMEDLLTKRISFNAGMGRQAVEWVIKLDTEMKDLANTAVKSTDELLSQTRRQIDDITIKTKRGMDDLQHAAKKSLDEIQTFTAPPSPQSMPKL
ncbi:protein slowmo [Microplitis mediator]|uniref:protein slowmo n=1 Tax=Microplitis mediator TaxID=375433 RepID=UPI002553F37D|nr:protein slowmo [Microplitis mediator]